MRNNFSVLIAQDIENAIQKHNLHKTVGSLGYLTELFCWYSFNLSCNIFSSFLLEIFADGHSNENWFPFCMSAKMSAALGCDCIWIKRFAERTLKHRCEIGGRSSLISLISTISFHGRDISHTFFLISPTPPVNRRIPTSSI